MLRAIRHLLVGAVLTFLVTFLLGWVLFAARSTWGVGQGDSFLVFYVMLWTTPIGGLYWAVVLNLLERHEKPLRVGPLLLVALGVYILGIAATLILFDVA